MDSQRESLQRAKRKRRLIWMLIAVVVVIVAVCVIVAVTVNHRSNDTTSQSKPKEEESASKHELLQKFLHKVREVYYECHPEIIIYEPISVADLKALYRPFDYSPANMKKIADTAANLLIESSQLITKEVEATLTDRQLKGVYEARQFLRHFGNSGPYDSLYYTGVWMLGPNSMVWEHIKSMWPTVHSLLRNPRLTPRSVSDFKWALSILTKFKHSVNNYTENMRLGVKAGMVRNTEACEAGLKALKMFFRGFALNNESEVLGNNLLQPDYIASIEDAVKNDWKRMHKKNLTSSLREALLEDVGKPVVDLMRYIETEHMRHCVPSSVSSGLASLPLKYIYIDGKPDLDQPTNPFLPTGERLNGSEAFDTILRYFTTSNITAEEIQTLGYQKLKEFKAKAVDLAKEATNESNDTIAVQKFRDLLSNRSLYFNYSPFPENESRDDTFLHCYNEKSAQRNCPKRFKAFSDWKKSSLKVQSFLATRIKELFYSSGKNKTTLSCSADVFPNFNPMSSFHTYQEYGCGIQYLPFFIDGYGPKFSEYTVTAHETIPGHNLEVVGYNQNFAKPINTDVFGWLFNRTYNPSFSEGWATYAEYPLIGKDLDIYKDDIMGRYGMLQQQIMGALRLVIETGLHSTGMSRSAALQLFKENAWEIGDIATKELTRYQSVQGHSVSYVVGQTAFLKARALAEKELGSKFSLKDFHYYMLRQGEVPLPYLDHVVGRYIRCTKDLGSGEIESDVRRSCEDVLF